LARTPSRGFLAGIITTGAALIGDLDGLTVHNAGGRLSWLAAVLAQPGAQRIVPLLPESLSLPAAKPFIDRLPRRKTFGQQTPGSAVAQHIEDGVEDRAPRCRLASAFCRWWAQWFEHGELGIGQIGRVTFWFFVFLHSQFQPNSGQTGTLICCGTYKNTVTLPLFPDTLSEINSHLPVGMVADVVIGESTAIHIA
jgi:hypothetical protein